MWLMAGNAVCSGVSDECMVKAAEREFCRSMISQLELSSNHLSGSIPDSIGNLKSLSYAPLFCDTMAVDVEVDGGKGSMQGFE